MWAYASQTTHIDTVTLPLPTHFLAQTNLIPFLIDQITVISQLQLGLIQASVNVPCDLHATNFMGDMPESTVLLRGPTTDPFSRWHLSERTLPNVIPMINLTPWLQLYVWQTCNSWNCYFGIFFWIIMMPGQNNGQIVVYHWQLLSVLPVWLLAVLSRRLLPKGSFSLPLLLLVHVCKAPWDNSTVNGAVQI